MPPNNLIQCLLERIDAQCAFEPNGLRGIVNGAVGLKLVEKPKTLLRKRERHGSWLIGDGLCRGRRLMFDSRHGSDGRIIKEGLN